MTGGAERPGRTDRLSSRRACPAVSCEIGTGVRPVKDHEPAARKGAVSKPRGGNRRTDFSGLNGRSVLVWSMTGASPRFRFPSPTSVAQLVEHRSPKPAVGGSIPSARAAARQALVFSTQSRGQDSLRAQVFVVRGDPACPCRPIHRSSEHFSGWFPRQDKRDRCHG